MTGPFTFARRAHFCESIISDVDNTVTADPRGTGALELGATYGFQVYDLVQEHLYLVLGCGVLGTIVFGMLCLALIPYCLRAVSWIIYAVIVIGLLVLNFLLFIRAGWAPAAMLRNFEVNTNLDKKCAPDKDGWMDDPWKRMFKYDPEVASDYHVWAVGGESRSFCRDLEKNVVGGGSCSSAGNIYHVVDVIDISKERIY